MQGIESIYYLELREEYDKNNYAWVFLLCQNMQELKQISRKLIFF